MAKLYYYYASMNAGKSAQLLTSAHNYEERGMNVMLFKPAIDTRTASTISSRIGLVKPCEIFTKNANLYAWVMAETLTKKVDCIFVDEAQFLTKMQVHHLCLIVDELNIPVLAYGLRTDFKREFFEGSQWLMAWADKIVELKGMCHCGSKATTVARVVNGEMVLDGDQVLIGAEETYVSLCRKHFLQRKLVP